MSAEATPKALAGRVALITGSARNIGRAIALAYADAGADVVVHGRTGRDEVLQVAQEARALGARTFEWLADVRDQAAVDEMVAEATAALGPIDLLVNNAAVRREGPFEEMSFDVWQEALAVTLDGAFHCSQAVIGGMLARGHGTIINKAGLTGQSGAPRRAHVVAAKAGLIGFTKALAQEYGGRGVTVNAVSPGLIDTVRGESAGGGVEPAHRQQRVIPVGRRGRPEEVAALCVYLASEPARYITGQVYAVNGGTYM
jgi:3-oxoacyl-[acyl-carrier protein] reductase